MLESKSQETQQKLSLWGAAQWEENHGVNVATAGDAAQGTNRKEKAPSSSCSATSTSIKRSEEGSTRRMEYGEGQGNKWI